MKPFSAVFFVVLLGSAAPLWSESGIEPAVREFRKDKGLSVPEVVPEFSSACAVRARDLAVTGVLSHGDDRGRGPGVQMLALGFAPGEYGEILGSGALWAGVWTAWLASPTHRDVLTTPGWTRWGWGRYTAGNTTVWVVRFYRP